MLTISDDMLFGLSSNHLTQISDKHALQKEALNAWVAMKKSANNAGFDLALVSSFRSFERQNHIWQRKFSGELCVLDKSEKPVNLHSLSAFEQIKAIMLFSALPGASRHHWGTDIDVYAPNLLSDGQSFNLTVSEYSNSGPFYELSMWLKENAKDFGFGFPYDRYRGGVSEEPWHLSYMPIAGKLLPSLSPEKLASVIEHNRIAGYETVIEHIEELFTTFVSNVGAH
ncbi:M15 family metallopeptidase [Thalassotalea euphylliae]|uniref:M15 family metallopeptidase n=1 Tax=Thalassotalea euphylliae TaxID=1655234 RepID=UPI0036441E31